VSATARAVVSAAVVLALATIVMILADVVTAVRPAAVVFVAAVTIVVAEVVALVVVTGVGAASMLLVVAAVAVVVDAVSTARVVVHAVATHRSSGRLRLRSCTAGPDGSAGPLVRRGIVVARTLVTRERRGATARVTAASTAREKQHGAHRHTQNRLHGR
jgi:hypothetical protein